MAKTADDKAKSDDAVPKVVARARTAITNLETLAGWDELKAAISSADLNILQTQLKAGVPGQLREKYKHSTKDQKAAIIKTYLIDPKTAVTHGINSLMNSWSKTDESEYMWLHRSEIKKRLHDDAMGDILCDSGELPDRQSEYKCFADNGYKQYYVHHSRFLVKSTQEGKAGNVSKAELTVDTGGGHESKRAHGK